MQKAEFKLSLISKSIFDQPLNSFEFKNNSTYKKPNFHTVEEHQPNNNHELSFLIDASKFYSILCPSLSSRLICKVANLTSEIDQTKSYSEFFSGKICPKCFSAYLIGANSKLDVKSVKGNSKKRLKNKILKQCKITDSQLTNCSLKYLFITCNFCSFIFKKPYWEKKIKIANKSKDLKDNYKNKSNDILDYSNYILGASNEGIQSNNYNKDTCKTSIQKNKKTSINRNLRFFNTRNQRAGSIPLETKNSKANFVKSTQSSTDREDERINHTLKGNSFYDILSMLE
ncbi:hypothetical protein OJ253_328 [Cryptosporidium canis]|uniref:RNAse P Rpr2/Rpp21 subunit domain-containing protein n=1 Tax=Cryptosporidium canis TaxID=195482 RepID=A0A9D5HVV6_9CRYT|nr:hypothetical protein OJ253_328 [Cryptosporidium canis]